MAINVELRDEAGATIDVGDVIDWRELPLFDDQSYPHLRLIDAAGDTIFSSYQMKGAVLGELERFATERPSPNLQRVLELSRSAVPKCTPTCGFSATDLGGPGDINER